ncbi:hypothetical protein HN873_029125 [Arachis hypogaea]
MRSSPSRGTKMRFESCLRAIVASSSSCQRRKVISSMTLNRASSLSLFFKQEMNLSLIGLQNAGKTFLVNVVAAESEEIRKKGFKGVENGDNAADEEGQRLVQENKEENKEGLKSLEPLLATEEDRKFGVPWLKLGGWGLTVTLGVPKVNPEVSAHYGLFLMGRTLKRSLFRGWKPKSDLPLLVEKYVNKEIQIDDYITHHLPFDDINNAFDLMKERKCLRCVIQMPR